MNTKLQINTRVRRLMHYIEDIEKGHIQIPEFQRDYIWRTGNILELFDSIKRGYPIGSILFWKPANEPFDRTTRNGPYAIPEPKNEYFYILDGFQRLSTLFGCMINPDKTELTINRQKWEREFRIGYDLKEEEFFIQRGKELKPFQVNVYNLIDTRYSFQFQRNLQEHFPNEEVEALMDRYELLGTTLIDYQLPSIDIIGGDIEEAVEIFSRVNSKGSQISPDWMVSALSYNKDQNFRLGTEIDRLLQELKVYNFNKIKRDLILNCITNSFGKFYVDQKLENLIKRSDFIDKTIKAISCIKKAVHFLYEELLVLDGKLLPYSAQLIFITDFFNRFPVPTPAQLEILKDWFWITTYSNYFTIYSLSKQRKAYELFQDFLNGKTNDPIYNDSPETPFEVKDFPNKIYYGSVRAKSIVLFLLNNSTNFKPINADQVSGIDLLYLNKASKGNNPPSCVVPIIKEKGYSAPKDGTAAYLLQRKKDSDFSRYLLSIYMLNALETDNIKKIETERYQLIREKEDKFITKLGLTYSVPKRLEE